ncbi:MAG: hypothetical protein KC584_11295, partial [Nitrospira sp.]|nr:hypothetical protein [Nitrospira sp.]
MKLGTGRCAIVTTDVQFVISAPEVEAVDTIGGGDAFAGAFSVAILEHQPPEQAAAFAVAASTQAVTGMAPNRHTQPTPNRVSFTEGYHETKTKPDCMEFFFSILLMLNLVLFHIGRAFFEFFRGQSFQLFFGHGLAGSGIQHHLRIHHRGSHHRLG